MTSKEWKIGKIGDFVAIKHGYAFKGEHIISEDNGIVLVTPGNFAIGGGFQELKCKYYNGEYPQEYILRHNDLIVTMTDLSKDGDTLGYCAKIPDNKNKIYLHNQRIGLLEFKSDKIIKDFLYWYMRTKHYQRTVVSSCSGSVIKHTSPSRICEIEIPIPPLEIQEKIARVLSSLDDKIELNNKINQNLEQQAQAIFDKYIKIPCNYLKTGTIGDYCNVKSGFAFKSSWWKDSGVKVIKIKTIDNESINFSECSFVDKEKISIAEDFIVKGGDLLIAMTGATIGKFAIVPKIDEVLLVNQRVGKFFLGIHPIKKLPFLYCTLKQQDIINDIINKGQGSAQPNISSTDILNTSCYILENTELEKFNLTCEPIFEKIITNKYENEKLKQLRDTLLPKLMSGEIDVDKVEV